MTLVSILGKAVCVGGHARRSRQPRNRPAKPLRATECTRRAGCEIPGKNRLYTNLARFPDSENSEHFVNGVALISVGEQSPLKSPHVLNGVLLTRRHEASPSLPDLATG